MSVSDPVPLAVVAFQSGKRANGGLESLFEIASRLRRVRPLLVTQCESPYTERWRDAGLEVEVWPVADVVRDSSATRLRRNARLFALNARLAAFLRARRIRIVHCNDGSAAGMSLVGARAANARVLLNLRDTGLGDLPKWRAFALLSRRIVVLSDEMRSYALERLAPPWPSAFSAKITAIPSIVDPARFSPVSATERARLRAALGIPRDVFAAGVVGAVMPKKRQLALLHALTLESAALPARLRCYFVGDFSPSTDTYAEECCRAAEPLGERIAFTGFRDDVPAWYRALDLVVVASRNEGLARSMIEGLACGTPVTAFDVCSAREVLEEPGAGRVVPQGDYRALFAAIAELERAPDLRETLGAAGARFSARAFAPERVIERYEDEYLSLAAR